MNGKAKGKSNGKAKFHHNKPSPDKQSPQNCGKLHQIEPPPGGCHCSLDSCPPKPWRRRIGSLPIFCRNLPHKTPVFCRFLRIFADFCYLFFYRLFRNFDVQRSMFDVFPRPSTLSHMKNYQTNPFAKPTTRNSKDALDLRLVLHSAFQSPPQFGDAREFLKCFRRLTPCAESNAINP
jgi:hypothetical protein